MKEIKERLGEHEENLLDEKAAQKKCNERSRIGFKK